MHSRAARLPKLRKIDLRVPVVLERGTGWDTPLFDAVDRAVLRAIDGRSTVHALAVDLGRSDDEIARTLARLERLRLVAMREPATRAPSSPPKRLDSGMRPAMKTRPSEDALVEVTRDDAADVLDLVPREPLPFEDEAERVIEQLEAQGIDAFEPEERLTLPGIGPQGQRAARR